MASIKHFFLLFICVSVLLTSGLADYKFHVCDPSFDEKDCDFECKEFGHPGGYCRPDRVQPRIRMCYCTDR
ncbi:putative defensin-like protein 280 [Arabidopsis thaliana]|uniref:Uncharacterized protein n=2 Tax=Arabidopsis TaxID=3701 RepID=A0A178W9X7_ARATH|nr:Knottin scorpion toxin-like superfamily [Arabidopsis thaliana x Arabidopsis arenosa]OAP15217.1 hypothetical protein AXX17_AT1G71470 [Arabidopsis thaliana]VYS51268.1 unnamed protein product [Arabidopsis thaliana]